MPLPSFSNTSRGYAYKGTLYVGVFETDKDSASYIARDARKAWQIGTRYFITEDAATVRLLAKEMDETLTRVRI